LSGRFSRKDVDEWRGLCSLITSEATTAERNTQTHKMKLDEITIGQTYRGTMVETGLVKRSGGYYTGYTRKATGRICDIEFRVDTVQGESLWGNWVEVCGKRRTVQNYFTRQLLDNVQVAAR
jgi:hypothetical protein